MSTCLGKSFSFGLLCVSFVNVYLFVYLLLAPLVLRVGCWNLLVFILKCMQYIVANVNTIKVN